MRNDIDEILNDDIEPSWEKVEPLLKELQRLRTSQAALVEENIESQQRDTRRAFGMWLTDTSEAIRQAEGLTDARKELEDHLEMLPRNALAKHKEETK